MKKLSKNEMILIQGGRIAPGCTATAVCSDGRSVSASGSGEGSNCYANDYVNTQNGIGYACFHPAGSGNSTCSYC